MAKKKKNEIYYLDTASLSVKKVRVSAKTKILRLLRYFAVGLLTIGWTALWTLKSRHAQPTN